MSVATEAPPAESEGVWIKSYVAHTDGLKDAAPIRAGECRHYSSMVGVARRLKLIGPDPGNYRDWVLEGVFEITRTATGERTRATRMFNRDRSFFMSVKPVLETGKTIAFAYDFHIERLPGFGGLKEHLEIAELLVKGFGGDCDRGPRLTGRTGDELPPGEQILPGRSGIGARPSEMERVA
jgi:hypothetical protein